MTMLNLIAIFACVAAIASSPLSMEGDDMVPHSRTKRAVNNEIYMLGGCQDPSAYTVADNLHTPYMERKTVEWLNTKRRAEPNAKNMLKLEWSDEMACQAQRAVETCEFEHTNTKEYAGYATVCGQNLYAKWVAKDYIKPKWSTMRNLLAQLYLEKSNYDYSTNDCIPGKVCNHFKQMVVAETWQVGSACKVCHSEWIIGGNYANLTTRSVLFCAWEFNRVVFTSLAPYKTGTPCTDCKAEYVKCDNLLCEKCGSATEEGCYAGNVIGCTDVHAAHLCNNSITLEKCDARLWREDYCKQTCQWCANP